MRCLPVLIFVLAAVTASNALGDTIHMKDGRKLEGKVVKKDGEYVHLEMKYGTQKLPLAEIEKMEIDSEEIPGLIRKLGDTSWRVREKASGRLVELGKKVMPYLEKALKSRDAEVRYRAEQIINAIGQMPAQKQKRLQELVEQVKGLDSCVEALDKLVSEFGRKALPEIVKALADTTDSRELRQLKYVWDLLNMVSEQDMETAWKHYKEGNRLISEWKTEVARLRKTGMSEKDAARAVLDRVINQFEKAVALRPGLIRARKELAVCYYRLGEFQLSLRHLELLVSRDPLDVSLLGTLVNCYVRLKKWKEANEHLGRILKIDPDNALAYAHLGSIAAQRRKYTTAIENFTKAMSLGCKKVSVLFNLAFAYEKKKKNDEAIKLYREVLEKKPNDYATLLRLGVLFYNLKRFDQSLPILEAFLKHHPKSSDASKVKKIIANIKEEEKKSDR
jgi:tetratricopeptide (TPR) repeat protein